jgi:hypothetical protein
LLLCLCIRSALLVSLIVTCLLLGLLVGPFLFLVMVDCTGCSGDDCRGDRGTSDGSSDHSSSHHIDLRKLRSRFRLGF